MGHALLRNEICVILRIITHPRKGNHSCSVSISNHGKYIGLVLAFPMIRFPRCMMKCERWEASKEILVHGLFARILACRDRTVHFIFKLFRSPRVDIPNGMLDAKSFNQRAAEEAHA